jgi:hypothetical protein
MRDNLFLEGVGYLYYILTKASEIINFVGGQAFKIQRTLLAL